MMSPLEQIACTLNAIVYIVLEHARKPETGWMGAKETKQNI